MIFKTLSYLIFSLLVIVIPVFGQDRHVCGTDEMYKRYIQDHPEVLEYQRQADELANKPQFAAMAPQGTIIIIPVVFHVIHINGAENISESIIQDQIKRMNLDFNKKNADTSLVRSQFKSLIANLNIEFRLARIDPYGKCTNGITRYYSDLTVNANNNIKSLPGQRWDSKKYLNVWVVSSIDAGISTEGTVLGYAYFPFQASSGNDGIVVRADHVGFDYRVITHELGHYFGLYHTFQDGCQSDCANKGDEICDTPPVADMNFGCNLTTNSCHVESPDQLDMLENYMDYTDCTYMFTNGQRDRMINLCFVNPGYRIQLASESNLKAAGVFDTNNISCKVVADFDSDFGIICQGNSVEFINKSFISSTVQYFWTFTGGYPPVSFVKNPSVEYTAPGKYDVKLLVKNSLGQDSILKQKFITVYPTNGYPTPMLEDFELATFTNNYWIVDDPVNTIGWTRTGKAAFTGGSCFYVNNFSNTQTDKEYTFITPPIDFTGVSSPLLTFRHSFAKKSDGNTDKLTVHASEDCGQTWSLRYQRLPYKLMTTSILYSNEFIPTNTTLWYTNEVDLSYFSNKPNVLIRFTFKSGGGNNVYLDDLNIGTLTSIQSKRPGQDKVHIYPNPASNVVYVVVNDISGPYEVKLTDIFGNLLQTYHSSETRDNRLIINLAEAGVTSRGIYLVQVISQQVQINKIITVTD
jgi:PKD repeat protein/predicted Zn-dependent protease